MSEFADMLSRGQREEGVDTLTRIRNRWREGRTSIAPSICILAGEWAEIEHLLARSSTPAASPIPSELPPSPQNETDDELVARLRRESAIFRAGRASTVPAAKAVTALIAKWRRVRSDTGAPYQTEICADELEAALAASHDARPVEMVTVNRKAYECVCSALGHIRVGVDDPKEFAAAALRQAAAIESGAPRLDSWQSPADDVAIARGEGYFQIGWYNTKYKAFFKMDEQDATGRTSEMLASCELIRVYALAAAQGADEVTATANRQRDALFSNRVGRADPAIPSPSAEAVAEPVIYVEDSGLRDVKAQRSGRINAYIPDVALIMSMPLTALYTHPTSPARPVAAIDDAMAQRLPRLVAFLDHIFADAFGDDVEKIRDAAIQFNVLTELDDDDAEEGEDIPIDYSLWMTRLREIAALSAAPQGSERVPT